MHQLEMNLEKDELESSLESVGLSDLLRAEIIKMLLNNFISRHTCSIATKALHCFCAYMLATGASNGATGFPMG